METTYRRLGIMGAGRTARAFALALAPFSQARPLLYARSSTQAERLRADLPDIALADHPGTLFDVCDLILLALSDDAIGPVAEDMVALGPMMGRPFVFHLSGRSGAAILDPLQDAGALTAAIHPVMTFTGDPQREVDRMKGAAFAVTASSPEAEHRAFALVDRIGGQPFAIAEEQRALYHGALSHAANHLVTLLAGSAQALAAAGVTRPYAVLAPLVRAALDNSLTDGFAALSGPLLRGDVDTIGRHCDAFAQFAPAILPDYRAMALATLRELESHGMGQTDRLPALRERLVRNS